MSGPIQEEELHLLTSYSHRAFPFCSLSCLLGHLAASERHRKELAETLNVSLEVREPVT